VNPLAARAARHPAAELGRDVGCRSDITLGPAFGEFVGDLAKWSTKFWDTYNKLKHAPLFEYDANEIRLLGDSGALLLLGTLLNGVAGNKTPMKVILQSHRTHMVGYNMRRLLANT
jgi:hypothetical protein